MASTSAKPAKPTRSATSLAPSPSVREIAVVGTHPFGTLSVHSGERRKGGPRHECLLSGDVAIVTGVPQGIIAGFDTLSLTVGKDGCFHGIREIPAGPHFLYASSASEVSTRNGFWIMSEQKFSGDHGDVFVRRWDSYSETLEDEICRAEVRIQTDRVPKVFNMLLPYNTSSSGIYQSQRALNSRDPAMWNRLTSGIGGALLTRLTSSSWNKWMVASNHESCHMEDIHTDAGNKGLDVLKYQQLVGKDAVLKFAFQQNEATYSRNVTGRARTEQALDTSRYVFKVICDRCTHEDDDEVIGEMQFSYLMGVLIGNTACQEQWAYLVKLLFKAFKIAMDRPEFFSKLIEAVHAQFIFDDEGMEGSIFENLYLQQEEFKKIFTVFKSRLNEMLLEKGTSLTPAQKEVGDAFEALESWLWKWGWDLRCHSPIHRQIQLEDGEFVDAETDDFEAEDERGEYAPLIVHS